MLLYIRFLDLNSFCIMETFCLIISYIRFLLPLWPFCILFCLFLLSSQTASLSDCAPCLGDLIELQEFQYHMGADASFKHTFALDVSPEFRLMSTSLFHLMSDMNLQLSLFQNWAPDFLFLVSLTFPVSLETSKVILSLEPLRHLWFLSLTSYVPCIRKSRQLHLQSMSLSDHFFSLHLDPAWSKPPSSLS